MLAPGPLFLQSTRTASLAGIEEEADAFDADAEEITAIRAALGDIAQAPAACGRGSARSVRGHLS